MQYVAILIVAALVFLLCFAADKIFARLFRNRREHKSGLSVRLNKKYGAIGLIVAVLGIAALFAGGKLMLFCGCFLILLGVGLVVYYMSFSIFYDTDTFLYSTFTRKTITYSYSDIKAQQLFTNYGHTVIELYMTDGRTVQLQSGMNGVYPFLDYASSAWQRQTGREDCSFYNPQNSCWFPELED